MQKLKEVGFQQVSRKVVFGSNCDILESIQFLGELVELVE